jgi:hypothetical protein
MPFKDKEKSNEYQKKYQQEKRKKASDGVEKKKGRKPLENEDPKVEMGRRKAAEKKQRQRARQKSGVLKVTIDLSGIIKQEPRQQSVFTDEPPLVDTDNEDDEDDIEMEDAFIPQSIMQPSPTVRLQSPSRPSHYHTPGFTSPQLTSTPLNSFDDSTPGPSHASTSYSPLSEPSFPGPFHAASSPCSLQVRMKKNQ